MINNFKVFLLALAAIGLLAGCATTTEEPEPAPEMTEAEPQPQPEPEPEPQIDTVFHFDFDRSELKPAARAALTAHAERSAKGVCQFVKNLITTNKNSSSPTLDKKMFGLNNHQRTVYIRQTNLYKVNERIGQRTNKTI